MYEPFFGLESSPFGLTPDPRFLFRSKGHHDILASLLYGVTTGKGIMLLLGDVGTGKTTLCRALLRELPEQTESVLILNPHLSDAELVGAILDDLGLERRGTTKGELMGVLSQHLLAAGSEGKTVVVVVDEAQQMSVESLEQIRLLSTIEAPGRKLLQIVLAGQPELEAKLARTELRQLNQRIGVRCRLGPLTQAETFRYIEHRLRAAGLGGTLPFSRVAMARIYRWSRGVPRLVNLLSDRALAAAFSARSRSVGVDAVTAAIRSLKGEGVRERSPRRLAVAAAVAAALVGVAVGGAFQWAAVAREVGGWRWSGLASFGSGATARPPEARAVAAAAPAPAPAPSPVAATTGPPVSGAAPADPPAQAAATAPSSAASGPVSRDPERRLLADMIVMWTGRAVTPADTTAWPSAADGMVDVAEVAGLYQLTATRLARTSGEELRAIGLPALLLLDGGSRPTPLLLRRISGDTATLVDGAGNETRRPLAEITASAGADAWVLWRNLDQMPTDPMREITPAVVLSAGLRLHRLGYLTMPLPRTYDARMEQAVRAFQQSTGLTQDGLLGPRTTLALARVVAGDLAPATVTGPGR